jgi:uncharacterized protein (UPF0248 family)
VPDPVLRKKRRTEDVAMVPILDLLNRIRWDKGFGSGVFEIGYLDHVERRIIRVPLAKIHLEKGNHFCFQLETEMSEMLTIPFHRIREVYRDGVMIWQRRGG